MPKIQDLGRYMIVSDSGELECLETLREARARVNELSEMGYYAYVQDLDHELAAL